MPFWKRPSEPVPDPEHALATGAPSPLAGTRVAVAIGAMIAAAAISGLLLLQHHGVGQAVAAVNQVCGDGAASGCEAVAQSPYAEVFGVPWAAIGLAFSAAVALLLVLGSAAGGSARTAAAALAVGVIGLALAVDLYLLGVQLFKIKALCRLCVATYALNALAFVVLLPARRLWGGHRRALVEPAGRVALGGWLVAALAVAVAVVATSVALRHGERAQAGLLLGAPAGAPAASPLPPASPGSEAARYQEEARVAQEQARRLQETIDDPAKLEGYLTDKARRDYEQAPVQSFNLKETPAKGPADAPIRVVEFSDFLCPYCKQIAFAFAGYIPQTANRVVVYFKNYPLDQTCNAGLQSSIHPGACHLALGAICAHEQGKFWAYHDRVFQSPPANPSPGDVVAIATAAGLDAAATQACMDNAATRQKLAAEIAEANQAQVQGTPTLFINGKKLPRIADFAQTVDRESARMGLPPLAAPPGGASGH